MVINYTVFAHTFHLYRYDIPLYKILQHGSTVIGLTLIIGFMYERASKGRKKGYNVDSKQKRIFWISIFLLTTIIFFVWYFIESVEMMNYGSIVIRFIDSSLISLLMISVFFKYRRNQLRN